MFRFLRIDLYVLFMRWWSITIPPASVNDDYGNTLESRSMHVTIECKPDGTCNQGENYITCPQDCPTGSKDDVCDGAQDGRIDLDCEASADPDSATVTTTLPAESQKPAGICNLIVLPLFTLLTTILMRKF